MKRLLIIVIAVLLTACTEKQPDAHDTVSANQKPLAVATNYPLYYFAREIAGDAIEVQMPVIEGDPAMWSPGGDDVSRLQAADLLIFNGAGYESWLDFTTLPANKILDTTTNRQDLLPIEETTVHQHGPQGEHSHQGTAFTTWLDPKLAIEQARAIMHGLTQLRPESAGLFAVNFEKLEDRLEQLDQSLARVFIDLGDQPVIFSHPVYQYLQQRYGINGRSVHWEPDVEPGTRDWIDFGNLLREPPAKLVIWEAMPLNSTHDRLIEMGVQSVVFDPGANPVEPADYVELMAKNTGRIAALK